jgi:hypothetical protein
MSFFAASGWQGGVLVDMTLDCSRSSLSLADSLSPEYAVIMENYSKINKDMY